MNNKISDERLKAFSGWDMPKYSTGVHPTIVEIKKMADELLALRTLVDFSDGECFLCRKRTISSAGNPDIWSIHLPCIGGNGSERTFHLGCVACALSKHPSLRIAAEELEKALERYFNALSDDCGDHCTSNCRECQARAALAEYRKVKNG